MRENAGDEFWLGDSNGPMGDVGAFMDSELRVDRADLAGHLLQLDAPRTLIAIVGAPGAGKSRLAGELAEALNARAPNSAAILAMDGFHLDNAVLEARLMRHIKGAPETFDIAGLHAQVLALKHAEHDHPIPVFDRGADAVVPAGAVVPGRARFVLIEGYYLLLARPGWRELAPLFDLSIRIAVPEAELRRRLRARWQGLPEAEALRRIEENDLPNGRMLRRESRAADLVITD